VRGPLMGELISGRCQSWSWIVSAGLLKVGPVRHEVRVYGLRTARAFKNIVKQNCRLYKFRQEILFLSRKKVELP